MGTLEQAAEKGEAYTLREDKTIHESTRNDANLSALFVEFRVISWIVLSFLAACYSGAEQKVKSAKHSRPRMKKLTKANERQDHSLRKTDLHEVPGNGQAAPRE